ncbi:MAG: transporter substrate-binding domain-containing protein [Desulfotomaculum sp.]|nr:transporter substrate-binding domain-containing protein [Desulfotomaculum sp.]
MKKPLIISSILYVLALTTIMYFFYDDVIPFPYNLTFQERAFLENIEEIRFLGDRDYPPFSYLENGQPAGYEANLIRFMNSKFADLNVRVSFQQDAWTTVQQQVRAQKADVLTGMVITEPRREYFGFTKAYAEIVFSVVQNINRPPVHLTSNLRNHKIIVQSDSASEQMLLSRGVKPFITVTDSSDAMQLLLANDHYYWVVGYPTAKATLQKNKVTDQFNITRLDIPGIDYAMAVHRDNTILLSILNKTLTSLCLDGVFSYLDSVYFGMTLNRDLNRLQKVPALLLFLIVSGIYFSFLIITTLKVRVARAAATNQKLYQELEESFNATLLLAARAVDMRDVYTGFHSRNVAIYAALIAGQAGLNNNQIKQIFQAALLHDIGKIAIPDEILRKPGRLTKAEYAVIKQHPDIGVEMLHETRGSLSKLIPLVQNHHEHYDGQGYPNGIEQKDLPTAIITLADALDAMTTVRPYRQVLSSSIVLDQLYLHNSKQFHPVAVKAFINLLLKRYGNEDLDSFLAEADVLFNQQFKDKLPSIYLEQKKSEQAVDAVI